MNFTKPVFLSILLLSGYINGIGQTELPPPPMPMPIDSSRLLIDKIIEVSSYEQYFMDYCSKKVISFANNNNWTKDKTSKILGSIKFEYFIHTIYYSYEPLTTTQLTKTLKLWRTLPTQMQTF